MDEHEDMSQPARDMFTFSPNLDVEEPFSEVAYNDVELSSREQNTLEEPGPNESPEDCSEPTDAPKATEENADELKLSVSVSSEVPNTAELEDVQGDASHDPLLSEERDDTDICDDVEVANQPVETLLEAEHETVSECSESHAEVTESAPEEGVSMPILVDDEPQQRASSIEVVTKECSIAPATDEIHQSATPDSQDAAQSELPAVDESDAGLESPVLPENTLDAEHLETSEDENEHPAIIDEVQQLDTGSEIPIETDDTALLEKSVSSVTEEDDSSQQTTEIDCGDDSLEEQMVAEDNVDGGSLLIIELPLESVEQNSPSGQRQAFSVPVSALEGEAASPESIVSLLTGDVIEELPSQLSSEQTEGEARGDEGGIDGPLQPADAPKSLPDNDDIAAGLCLSSPTRTRPTCLLSQDVVTLSQPLFSAESPTQDIEMMIDDNEDTALLKDFLSRAAASKASKAANINRRESLSHRRDSDIIKQALASPRKALEAKDPNTSSPLKPSVSIDIASPEKTVEAVDDEDTARLDAPRPPARRSSRSRQTRIPPPANTAANTPGRITIRMPGDALAFQKTEAQELAAMTKSNTRRNKGKSVPVSARLKYLKAMQMAQANADSINSIVIDEEGEASLSKKGVTWDEQLEYTQDMDTRKPSPILGPALVIKQETTVAAIPDGPVSAKNVEALKRRAKDSNESPPASKIRRLRGLGASNGTPAKGLLLAASSLLPLDVQGERAAAVAQSSEEPTAKSQREQRTPSKLRAPALPQLQMQPSVRSVTATTSKRESSTVPPAGDSNLQRKSKLAAPKKVVLPPSVGASKGGNMASGGSESGLGAIRPVKRKVGVK